MRVDPLQSSKSRSLSRFDHVSCPDAVPLLVTVNECRRHGLPPMLDPEQIESPPLIEPVRVSVMVVGTGRNVKFSVVLFIKVPLRDS